MARTLLALRKRRAQYLYRAMFGEPAYDMLLGLYVAESDEQPITAARLAHIAGVAQSSAARWIEYLVAKDLIHRERHPSHKRASILKLSSKGRDALNGMFATMCEALCDVRA
jgi:DNA-binding MarR family transcriptional regulator